MPVDFTAFGFFQRDRCRPYVAPGGDIGRCMPHLLAEVSAAVRAGRGGNSAAASMRTPTVGPGRGRRATKESRSVL